MAADYTCAASRRSKAGEGALVDRWISLDIRPFHSLIVHSSLVFIGYRWFCQETNDIQPSTYDVQSNSNLE
jgi:hypothetical protein